METEYTKFDFRLTKAERQMLAEITKHECLASDAATLKRFIRKTYREITEDKEEEKEPKGK